jgi:hypothetical protein
MRPPGICGAGISLTKSPTVPVFQTLEAMDRDTEPQ